MTEKIGNVKLNYDFYAGNDLYSDGDIEDVLLEIVRDEKDFDRVIAQDNRWPILYHLSRSRQNIIEVMDIDKSDDLLEIGAGCGALTGGFSTRAGNVTCIDLSKKRSMINAERNKSCNNIEIIVGNFSNIKFEKTFDVITLIGVLEYADSYMEGDSQAHIHFLEKMHTLLNPGGRVYIAIENKYGLKYFAGCTEDHTGRQFDGITDYNNVSGVRTFAKSELEKMIFESGFKDVFFYYPMPDYKFASQIFSDGRLPEEGELYNLSVSYDRERDILFSEEKAYDGLIHANYFDIFANSYLIEATKE